MTRVLPQFQRPVLRHILNLWTMVWYPSRAREWKLERKIAALAQERFDGFMDRLTRSHRALAEEFGLETIGFLQSADPKTFRKLLAEQQDAGAKRVNVHLGRHDTETEVALALAVKLNEEADRLALEASIEVHRDTCTETPEKTYRLAEAFHRHTGRLLRLTWDHSHLAVVKHVLPPFWERFGEKPELIQAANQFHLRPFNGHHCQVPVTDGRGRLTPEFLDYREFLGRLLETWLQGASPGAELFAVPELGPVWLGYNLRCLPNSWDDARVLKKQIQTAWRKALADWHAPHTTKTHDI